MKLDFHFKQGKLDDVNQIALWDILQQHKSKAR